MKKFLLGACTALGLGGLAVFLVFQLGIPDFAADQPHHPAVHRLIEWAREQSIARRAADVVPPADLADANRIRRGAGNYEAMCVNCHLAPGIDDSEIRQGLYPTPPNLAKAAVAAADASVMDGRRFWIIKHGVKASAMPAWSKGGMDDAAIWDLTALLKVLPTLSADAYRAQVAASEGHTHAGMQTPPTAIDQQPAKSPLATKPHAHRHGDHAH